MDEEVGDCHLYAVDQVLQHIYGPQALVIILRHVSQDRLRLIIAADSLLDGGVDAMETLDGRVGFSFVVIDLLSKSCGRRAVVFRRPSTTLA